MTTQEYLAKYSVTMEQAKAFVVSNLDNLDVIYSTAKEFGVDNDMLSEIVSDDFPSITGDTVYNYLNSHGLDAMALGFRDSGVYHKFTTSDLVGKTLYDVSTNDSGSEVTKGTFTFTDDSHGTATDGSQQLSFTYTIDTNGILKIDASDETTSYIKAFDDIQNGGLQLKWMDSNNANNETYEDLLKYDQKYLGDIDFFFDNVTKADDMINKVNNMLSEQGMSIDDVLSNIDTQNSTSLTGISTSDIHTNDIMV
jgi:hypothetical protein